MSCTARADRPDHRRRRAARGDWPSGPVTYYGGFDPTAPSLHFGNLVLLVTMRRLQLAGHRPVGLVGGATGLVGDPSGRSAERQLHERERDRGMGRAHPLAGRAVPRRSSRANAAIVVNNLEWTARAESAIDWLRDVGKHFSVNRMLAKEAVAARLDAGGISYTEFSYQVMQAIDFLELYRRHGVTLQLGGSDQWGNLTAGVDLIRRVEGTQAHALATPLITRPDGEKFGKSTGDALARPGADDAVRVLPVAQHRRQRRRHLPAGLQLPPDEIEALEASGAERPDAREAQRALALEVTELVHGTDAAAGAADGRPSPLRRRGPRGPRRRTPSVRPSRRPAA